MSNNNHKLSNLNIFNKKKHKNKETLDTPSTTDTPQIIKLTDENKIQNEINLEKGVTSLKEILAPSSFDRSDPGFCVLNNKYLKSFILKGYPQVVYVSWLNELIHYDGDMDVIMHIDPCPERSSLDAITLKITQYETQLALERQKGNNKNITLYTNKIQNLIEERAKIELNLEKLFYVQIGCTLYSDSKNELEKASQKLDNSMRGKSCYLMPTYLRMDEGYKSISPYGKSYLPNEYRNLNSSALTACFPFYNNDISHENGVFFGINLYTMTPILIDFYDRKKLFNSNITVIGQAGSGKTFSVSLLTMRSALKGIRTVIIDPENEYYKLTKAFNGVHLRISADSTQFINPFDIEEEDVLDENDQPTGEKIVNVRDKAADMLNLIAIMAGGLSTGVISKVSKILQELYTLKGITEKPEDLYINEPYFDELTGELKHAGMKKTMPRFSDFHNLLVDIATKNNDEELLSLSQSLRMYKQGGLYDLFDCYTTEELENFKNSLIVTFDVSQLEENILRPIGMYVALSWTWTKFAKKNINIQKRIIIDETWLLMNPNMKGHEFTAQFVENASRRIRKRNGGLLVATQSFQELANSPQGRAVLQNAFVNIFLKQSTSDIDEMQEIFKLSDGEKNFLLRARKGEVLIKIDNESSAGFILPFEFEKNLIEKKRTT